jgi:hypothetical protein
MCKDIVAFFMLDILARITYNEFANSPDSSSISRIFLLTTRSSREAPNNEKTSCFDMLIHFRMRWDS